MYLLLVSVLTVDPGEKLVGGTRPLKVLIPIVDPA